MLNLGQRQTKSAEISGEGETKYRFTFARFSAPERQRHVFREEIAKTYAAEEAGIKLETLYELVNRRVNGLSIKREDYAATDLMLASLAWARVFTALTMLERFDVQWYPEQIPSAWNTPEGFLGSFESIGEVFELDNVVIDLNGDILGVKQPSEPEKKKDEENTESSTAILVNSPDPSTTTKTRRTRKTNLKK